MRICVVGLGKLGAPLAAVLASAGHEVFAVDSNRRSVELLGNGLAPVEETGLQELLDGLPHPITATTSIADAVHESEISFVIVPTPSAADGTFVLEHVIDVVEKIGQSLSGRAQRHVVTITSTVLPGSTDGPIRTSLETAAGRRLGEDLGLCYSPEFIALGSVIRDLTTPDFVLIGECVAWAGDLTARVLGTVVPPDTPIRRMSPASAEITKLAVNTFVTTKISYGNLLGEVCEQVPGADVDEVTAAVGLDTRIGARYLTAAAAYGGPCFPRDNAAFQALAQSVGVSADLPLATDLVNRRQTERIVRVTGTFAEPPAAVTVLGIAYKPATAVVEESPGIAVASALTRAGYVVTAHDPVATGVAEVRTRLAAAGVTVEADLARSLDDAYVAIVMTPWPDYETLDDVLPTSDRPLTVLDCWGIVTRPMTAPNVHIARLGASGNKA